MSERDVDDGRESNSASGAAADTTSTGTTAHADWTVPGVARAVPPVLPSAEVSAVRAARDALATQDLAVLSDAEARADLEALLAASAVLGRVRLARLADAQTRQLHRQAGFRSTTGWLAEHGGASSAELTVARKLGAYPAVRAALLDGSLTVPAGQQLQAVLGKLRPHLDPADGLRDGQDAEAPVTDVVLDGIRLVLAQARGGFPALTDPDLVRLSRQLEQIAALAVRRPPGSIRPWSCSPSTSNPPSCPAPSHRWSMRCCRTPRRTGTTGATSP